MPIGNSMSKIVKAPITVPDGASPIGSIMLAGRNRAEEKIFAENGEAS